MKTNYKGKRLNEYLKDYVVFDLETTGVRPDSDEILEISAIRVRDHQAQGEYSTLVNPGVHIPAGATAINHITDEMVREAPRLSEALAGFLEFAGNDVLIGHNIHSFDLNFLSLGLMRAFGKEIANDYIDTLFMARLCLPQLSHHKLSDVADHFKISTEGAHRALKDCVINQECYEKLGKILEETKKRRPEICCPRCGLLMVKRKGKYGEFYGCSDYPRCRGTRKI